MSFVGSAIILGLVGNLHCVGMCGPIAFVLPLNRSNRLTKTIGILIYNIGRVLTYATLGGLFGLFGQSLNIGKFQQIAAIAFGATILLWVLLPVISKKLTSASSRLIRWNNFVKSNLGKRLKRTSNFSLFTIGLLNGLLPCGLVYMAIAGSLATGNAIEGALFMTLFGIGTLPIMMVAPYFANSLSQQFRAKTTKALPYVLTVLGLLMILRGMNLGIPYLSPKFTEDNSKVASCCHAGSTSLECHE